MIDRPAFQSALRELGPAGITVADIGARWGAADAWFRLKPLARLIGFEADPIECARLNSHADSALEKHFPLALGRTDGPGTLYVTVNPGCSSLYPPSQLSIDCHPGLRDFTTLKERVAIELTRLDTWSRRESEPRLDFLKLDAQGAELDILTGAGDLLDNCVGVEAEVAFFAMYDGQPLFADVDQFLRSRGFTFWRFDSLAHYSDQPGEAFRATGSAHYDSVTSHWSVGSGRLVWANAIYFRERRTLSDRRSLLILAAFLEALGDPDGSRNALADASPLLPRPGRLASRIAAMPEVPVREQKRVVITCGCADARSIPKVPNAGAIAGDVQIMHNGVKVVNGGYHGAWMRAIIEHLDGHHEPQDEKAFHAIMPTIRPGGVMIELGAFWAYYSLWFAQVVPDAKLILIEPDPVNLEIGKRNLELNNRSAEWVQASVGPASLPPRPFACESDGRERMLPEVCVDELLNRFGVERCEVLLSDIQGAEVGMLEGAVNSIKAGRIRWVVISTHHVSISLDPATHAKCLAFVLRYRGHVIAELTPDESFSGDGLIVASFDAADAKMPRVELSRNGAVGSLY